MSVHERMKKEIFESPCFNLLKSEVPDFLKFIEEKVEAVEGDIVMI